MFIFFWIFIQILTEVLPISSSGHIFLLEKIWNFVGCHVDSNQFAETINFLLHIPTLFVLLIFFFNRWWIMVLNKPVHYSVFFEKQSWIKILQAIVFFGCSSAVTVLFWWKKWFHYFAAPLSIGFLSTALVLYALKYFPQNRGLDWQGDRKNSWLWQVRNAFTLGFVQGAMMNPGFSRFGFTLFFARVLGYNARTAFEISFLLEAPLLLGAAVKGLVEVHKNPVIFSEYVAIHGVFVMLVATIVSYFVLKSVNKLVEKNKLHYISGYMIIPLIITLLFERCS